MKKSLPQTGKDFHLSDIIENAVLLLAVDSEQRRIGKGDFVQAIALENEVMLIADALLRTVWVGLNIDIKISEQCAEAIGT